MDRLPLEMWTAVCSQACIDGGITGCALAATSHYLRDAVLPVQLQSIVLNDVKHAARFLSTLKARPPKHRRVLYLFLSNVSKNPGAQPHGWNELRGILQDILTLVAPDLRVLTDIIVPRGLRPHSLPNVPFPALEELTIHGSLISLETSALDPDPLDQLSFPSLKFLHYISQCDGVETYTSHAPVLTHLRLSGITGVSVAMQNTLHRLLQNGNHNEGRGEDSSDSTTDHSSIIPSKPLERIIVEPDSRVLRFRLSMHRQEALSALKNIDTDGRLVVLRPKADDGVRYAWGVRERANWDERLAGGEGCWLVPPESDTHRHGAGAREPLWRGMQFLGL